MSTITTVEKMARDVERLLADVDELPSLPHAAIPARIAEICRRYRPAVLLSAIVRLRAAERRRP